MISSRHPLCGKESYSQDNEIFLGGNQQGGGTLFIRRAQNKEKVALI